MWIKILVIISAGLLLSLNLLTQQSPSRGLGLIIHLLDLHIILLLYHLALELEGWC